MVIVAMEAPEASLVAVAVAANHGHLLELDGISSNKYFVFLAHDLLLLSRLQHLPHPVSERTSNTVMTMFVSS